MADEFCLKMPDFHVIFRDLLQAVNVRHGINGFTSLPKEGVLRIFSLGKIRRFRPGLNPRTWVPKASTLPLDHRSHCQYYDTRQSAQSICMFRDVCKETGENPLWRNTEASHSLILKHIRNVYSHFVFPNRYYIQFPPDFRRVRVGAKRPY